MVTPPNASVDLSVMSSAPNPCDRSIQLPEHPRTASLSHCKSTGSVNALGECSQPLSVCGMSNEWQANFPMWMRRI